MMLQALTSLPPSALPIAAFRDHLRLGTGFADDTLQDDLLEACLRAALTAIEARTDKALLMRDFTWSTAAWRDLGAQALPIAPVSAIAALRIIDRLGGVSVIDPARYRLVPDTHRPRLSATSLVLPAIPVAGRAEVDFTAGFGAWADLPADLARAVLLLAAQYYETRTPEAGGTQMPFGVADLIARHRNVRLFGGLGR